MIECFDHFGRFFAKNSLEDLTQGAENPRNWLSLVGRRPQRKCRCRFNHPVFQQQRNSSPLAFDGLGNSSGDENGSDPVKYYWEIIADNLKKAGWSLGYVSAMDSRGRTIWIADAHRDDGKRFVGRADEKLTAFVELESVSRESLRFPNVE
jgi:hypothetical protein